MNIKILATSLAMIGCGLAVTMISCNSDKNGIANAPTQPTHGGKAPQVLANNCNSILAVDRCAVGAAATAYDQNTGILSATGLTDAASGVKSTFLDAHNWHQVLNTSMPKGPGDQLSAVAYKDDTRQARLDVTLDQNNAAAVDLNPTFDAGDGNYTVSVYNNGQKVAEQKNVPPGSTTEAFIIIIWYHYEWGFAVIDAIWIINDQKKKETHLDATNTDVETGACQWTLGGPGNGVVDFKLPDGTLAHGDEIRFTEEVDGSGRYPYHSTNRMDVLSNLGSFDVLNEHASN